MTTPTPVITRTDEVAEREAAAGSMGVAARLAIIGLVGVTGILVAFNSDHFARIEYVSNLLGVVWVAIIAGLGRTIVNPWVAHGGLGFYGLTVVASYCLELESHVDSMIWLLLLGQLGVYTLGYRGGVLWSFGAVVLALLGIVLRPFAPHFEVLAYEPTLMAQVRFVTLLLLFLAMGGLLSRDRIRQVLELAAADRSRSAFLATMSHEIRTPMNGVLGMTEVMLQNTSLDAETRDQLGLIQRSGESLVALINDILDFSKIEAGKLRLQTSDFDLIALMGDLHSLFEHSATTKGITLELNTINDVPRVLRGDALRLRQVLANLINNAVKFTEHGAVTLRASKVSTDGARVNVRFVVEDTGIGIAPEVLPKLFTLFEQGDVGTTRRYGGTGLGLALSQQLVTLLGGTLEVTSERGRGSKFTFTAWFERGVQALVAPKLRVETARERHGGRVLVVDDNPINMKVARGLLQKAGYDTESAVNGSEALEKVKTQRYVMVLMDCHMPVMDGFEATERIRGLDGDAALTPIIALTASALPEELEACRRAGMNECLTKPVSMQMLQRVLGEIGRYQEAIDRAPSPSTPR